MLNLSLSDFIYFMVSRGPDLHVLTLGNLSFFSMLILWQGNSRNKKTQELYLTILSSIRRQFVADPKAFFGGPKKTADLQFIRQKVEAQVPFPLSTDIVRTCLYGMCVEKEFKEEGSEKRSTGLRLKKAKVGTEECLVSND